MCRWYTLSVLAALMAAAPAMAANDRTSSTSDRSLAPSTPVAVQAPALPSAPDAAKPVLTARAPFTTTWNSTLLSVSSQSMGLQSSARGANDHVRWTIVGAAVGAIIGAVADEPLRDAAIGAAVGFGASYVVHR